MKHFIKYITILALSFVFIGCEPEFDEPVTDAGFFSSGDANFFNYVAVGNSLTAGFADGALYVTGQENSYPNIMANQFALAGGGDFNQPLMNDNLGGLIIDGVNDFSNRFVLATDADGTPGPAVLAGIPTSSIQDGLTGSFNNMGVPGARSFDLLFPGYGNVANLPNANPYYVRFASEPNATVIGDAVAQNPTFFSLWIGNNDILGFATSGGAGVDQVGNLDPSTYGTNDITDPSVFASVYSQQVEALVATGAQGVLVNLPDVTSIPFFTTVPAQSVPLDGVTAATLNQAFEAYNTQVLPGLASSGNITPEELATRQINFVEGANFVTMQDENLTDISAIVQGPPFNLDPITAGALARLRQATTADIVPLSTAGVLGTRDQAKFDLLMSLGLPEEQAELQSVNGITVPLADQFVLTSTEQAAITAAQASYNATIEALAAANNLALADAQSALRQVANEGTSFNGGVLTSTFVTGGAFSLDGVHPTPRGYALTANVILDAINTQYGSTIPNVDIGNFGAVTLSDDVN